MTISALRRQLLVLHQNVLTAMFKKGAPPAPNASIVAGLHEDIEYLLRHIDRPSFQTELVATRIQTALRTL